MRREPWHPAEYDDHDVAAFKALAQGKATDYQQKLALSWIVNKASMVGDQSFYVGNDGDRITAFIEGRRSVGNQIMKLVRDIKPPAKGK